MKKFISLTILVLFFSIKGFAQFYSEPDVLLFLVTKSPFTNKSTGISLKFTDMAAQLSSGSNKFFQPQIRILSNTLASVSYQSLVTQGYSVSFYVNAKTLSIIDRKDNSVYNSGTPQGFDEMMKEMDAKAKQDKLIDEQWAKKISADMKRISTYINSPQSRKNVPEQFEKVKHDWLISDKDFFSESDKALYTKLDKVSEEILQENLHKTGDKYGVESNMSLISFMNSKGTKMELPTECKLYQSGDLVPIRMSGYVKDGVLYTSDGLIVGKINQDEIRFYIDFKDSKGKNLRINIYKDWDYARFNFALEESYYISVCDSSKIEYDCKGEGISIVIRKDAPKGTSLVAAVHLFNLINPKQTSNSETNETIKDIDGNLYNTVKIGTQVWMVENLKTTKYRNGDKIPNITSNETWPNLTTGAYCSMWNDSLIVSQDGLLYNWHAATDSRNIAPTGWHVPNSDEWKTLFDFLGGIQSAQSKLIKKSGFFNGQGGDNGSGFTAVPGGQLDRGTFCGEGMEAWWWTSSESNETGRAICVKLPNFDNDIFSTIRSGIKSNGFSIRCIKD